MIMTPKKDIRVLDWEIASRVKVENILVTMKAQDCCHLLVIENGELRGIFSRSEINKHLEHADMEQLSCAHSLAELIHRVA
jgi:predicted transcriptional regulator